MGRINALMNSMQRRISTPSATREGHTRYWFIQLIFIYSHKGYFPMRQNYWQVLSQTNDFLKICLLPWCFKTIWNYRWLSLSRPRLSRITAYLEVKICSLPKDENLITVNRIFWKRGEIAPKKLLPQYFQYISNFKSPVTYTFVKCDCSIYFSSIL